MKPVIIFQHSRLVGPGHFASFLDRREIPWRLVRTDLGEAIPSSCADSSGLCFLGGEMSVNDPLPWIDRELALIREALANDIPVIGHCLGGQLMAKALGARVSSNPVREIGWNRVYRAATPAAHAWLGELGDFDCFHWHGETFALPAGAEPLLSSTHCGNQAFAIGPHLGMQCHVEMTPELIGQWTEEWSGETAVIDVPGSPVQSAELIRAETAKKLPAMRVATERLYTHWLDQVMQRVQPA
ncbi:type 1 glutamine amidotransferase [Uliginosibacterium paludis]|uniref:Type 1 glutamine amidotransferase n=1 Tax=Uliginosibacterium paludis TaxID=1615952 RepID=A0ABV2CKD5_9RHOO